MQWEFFQNATHRWNFKTGATRSGKTHMDYYVIPKRIRNCTGNGLIVLIGNTQGTLERNIFEPMRSMFGDTLVGKVRIRILGAPEGLTPGIMNFTCFGEAAARRDMWGHAPIFPRDDA